MMMDDDDRKIRMIEGDDEDVMPGLEIHALGPKAHTLGPGIPVHSRGIVRATDPA